MTTSTTVNKSSSLRLKFHKSVKTSAINNFKPCRSTCNCTEEDNCSRFYDRIECPPTCKGCQNQHFRTAHAKVEVRDSGAKGKGVYATQFIPADSFVMPFIAEVISKDEKQNRRVKYAEQKIDHYFFGSGSYTNDATKYGNDAKYLNHSCAPNMVALTWSLHGTPFDYKALGFVADRDIQKGEELTFNYGDDYSTDMVCHCGAPTCAGIVGQKPKKATKKPSSPPPKPIVKMSPRRSKRTTKAPISFADQFVDYYLKHI